MHGDLSAGNVLLASGTSLAGSGADPGVGDSGPAPQGLQEQQAAGLPLQQQAQDGRCPEDALVSAVLCGCWRPPVVAKVADFGLSVALGEDQTHASRRFQGTPAYTAPEVLALGRLGKAADVWAFGVLLLEVAGGRPGGCKSACGQFGTAPSVIILIHLDPRGNALAGRVGAALQPTIVLAWLRSNTS